MKYLIFVILNAYAVIIYSQNNPQNVPYISANFDTPLPRPTFSSQHTIQKEEILNTRITPHILNNKINAITLYPNPARSHITIKGNNPFEVLDIILASGHSMSTKINASTESTFYLDRFPAGQYYIKVSQGNMLKLMAFTKL